MRTVSQTAAIRALREQTGLSYESCTAAVKRLPKIPDGKREKVRLADLNSLANELTAPRSYGRQASLSRGMAARIRQFGSR